MSSTRDFESPGVFASSATTTIPPTPIAGVSYRDAVGGTDDVQNGWRYGTRVESQDFNQIMFLVTSMLGAIDKKGVIGWSDQVDYDESAITFGSDGQLYLWLQASGPNNGGVRDPISSPAYWQDFTSRFGGSPGDVKAVATAAAPSGWLKANGAAVSRTTYAALFSAIGTTFGAGDGTTTFNLPDLRAEFIRGLDDGRNIDIGRALGSSQIGSLNTYDLAAGIGCQTARSTSGATDVASAFGADPAVPATYPGIGEAGVVAAASPLSTNTVIGTVRPRNVALLYVIKT